MTSNLIQRVLVALCFGPLLLVVFWTGGVSLLAVLCIVGGGGAWEFYRMQEQKGLHPWKKLGVAASLSSCVWAYGFGREALWAPLGCFLLLLMTLSLNRRENKFRFSDAAATLLGALYTGFLGSFALLVRNFSAPRMSEKETAAGAVLVLLGIWAADAFAYFSGRAFGRRHPFPTISPGKTEAGFVGSLVGALAISLVGSHFFGPFTPWEAAGLGLLVGIGSPLGDLVESALKRDAGVKDASGLIPGHGGLLDRFDSFLFVYPLTYFYLCLLQTF